MSTATLDGHRVTRARLQIPAYGPGWAEVTLDEEVTLAGSVTLTIADLSWVGTVASGGPTGGRSGYRLVGGAGGWGREVAAKPYANDAGVKLSTVATDVAAAAGETLAGDIPTTRLGQWWAREAGPAGRVLDLLAPRAWYVDELGQTRFGRRPSAALAVEATRGPADLSVGRVTLAADSIATILPGVIVDGIEALDVLHEVGGGSGLRSTIWGVGAAGDRSLEYAFEAYLLRLFPWLPYARTVEYRVVTLDGERANLQAVLSSIGLPDLERVVTRPGVPGVRAEPALGSRVLVCFVNADPGRPAIVAFEEAEADGFAPTVLELSQEDDNAPTSPIGRVVRYGDSVTFLSPGVGVLSMGTPAPFSRAKG